MSSNAKAQDVQADEAQAQDKATFGIEALCEATGASGKDVRRWIRATLKGAGASEALPGKGGRYAFTGAQVERYARAYQARKAQAGSTSAASALDALLEA